MTTAEGKRVVVFVCVKNAGRSQMAEAIFNRKAEGRMIGRSAGSAPADAVHPEVAEAMAEVGMDISAAKPKGLVPEVLEGADYVVGMGCGDECPHIPGAKRFEWDVADPAGLPLNEVRGIRQDISRQIDLLIAEMNAGG
ncbi:MAG: arsenate reductase ArsC [Actinomycetota bacterium]